jgi:lipoprotein
MKRGLLFCVSALLLLLTGCNRPSEIPGVSSTPDGELVSKATISAAAASTISADTKCTTTSSTVKDTVVPGHALPTSAMMTTVTVAPTSGMFPPAEEGSDNLVVVEIKQEYADRTYKPENFAKVKIDLFLAQYNEKDESQTILVSLKKGEDPKKAEEAFESNVVVKYASILRCSDDTFYYVLKEECSSKKLSSADFPDIDICSIDERWVVINTKGKRHVLESMIRMMRYDCIQAVRVDILFEDL